MKTIELTVIEAAELADVLENLYLQGVSLYGIEKLPQEYVTGLALAEEIMNRVKAKQGRKSPQLQGMRVYD